MSWLQGAEFGLRDASAEIGQAANFVRQDVHGFRLKHHVVAENLAQQLPEEGRDFAALDIVLIVSG